MTVTVVETSPGEEDAPVTETTVDAAAEAALQAETSAAVAAGVADGVVALAHQQAAAAQMDAAITIAETEQSWQELSTRITQTEASLAAISTQLATLTEMVSSIRQPPVVTEVEEPARIEPAEILPGEGVGNRAVETVRKLYRARL